MRHVAPLVAMVLACAAPPPPPDAAEDGLPDAIEACEVADASEADGNPAVDASPPPDAARGDAAADAAPTIWMGANCYHDPSACAYWCLPSDTPGISACTVTCRATSDCWQVLPDAVCRHEPRVSNLPLTCYQRCDPSRSNLCPGFATCAQRATLDGYQWICTPF